MVIGLLLRGGEKVAVLELKLAERWLFSLKKWRESGYFDKHKILKVAEKWLLLSKNWRILKISFWQHWSRDQGREDRNKGNERRRARRFRSKTEAGGANRWHYKVKTA